MAAAYAGPPSFTMSLERPGNETGSRWGMLSVGLPPPQHERRAGYATASTLTLRLNPAGLRIPCYNLAASDPVNSHKYLGRREIKRIVLKTNPEAAKHWKYALPENTGLVF